MGILGEFFVGGGFCNKNKMGIPGGLATE